MKKDNLVLATRCAGGLVLLALGFLCGLVVGDLNRDVVIKRPYVIYINDKIEPLDYRGVHGVISEKDLSRKLGIEMGKLYKGTR